MRNNIRAAEQFLHLRAEQKGIDVVLVVTALASELLEINTSQGQTSYEEAFLLIERSGIVQVEIRSATSKAPAGKYDLIILALRSATEQDRSAVKAQQLEDEAARLDAQNKRENFPNFERYGLDQRTAG